MKKIKAIQANGTYKSNYGLLYKFEYEFEDGEVVQANHKTENSPFNIGDEVEVEVTKTFDWGKIAKVSKPKEDFKPKFDTKGIEAGHAINNAVNLICAGVELNVDFNSNEEKIYKYAEVVYKISQRLKNNL